MARLDDLDLGPDSCVIYCRISSDPTGEKAGVERQEEECRALARRLGLHVDKVLIDNDTSATSGVRRPAFEELVESRPPAVVTWAQDRLLRLTSDLEQVIALGVPVYTVVAGTLDLATPAGRAVARTVAAWSQYEGEQKALRQRAANRQRAERGGWVFSRRPFGYQRVDGRIEQVPAEVEAVQEAFAAYLRGDSYQTIVDDFNARGITTTLGVPWRAELLAKVLANPRYAGIVIHRGEELPDVEASWQPAIDRRTWADFTEMKGGRKKAGAPSAGRPRHLVSGLAFCGVCGDPLYATMIMKPPLKGETERRRYRVYECVRRRCISVAADSLETFVEAVVLGRLGDKKIIRALRTTPDTAPLEEELAELRRNRSNVADLVGDGLLSRRDARAKLEELNAKSDRTQARLNAMRAESPLTDLALARSVAPRWRKLDVIARRRVIADLGLRLTINRGQRGVVYRDADGNRTINPERVIVDWVNVGES